MKSILTSLLFVFIGLFWSSSIATGTTTCDCSSNLLNCSDFASPADAQGCFWYCGSQGVGDIHQLDTDLNQVACDVLSVEIAPLPISIPVSQSAPLPTVEPTAVIYSIPTAVPQYEVCACGGDYYDCDTFSGPSHAQGCYDYCAAQGLGDIHQMDSDGDGMACLVSGSVAAVSVAPTAMPVLPTVAPVYVAPTAMPTMTPVPYVAPTAIPTVYVPPTVVVMPAPVPVSQPTSTPLPYIPGVDVYGIVVNPDTCACNADYYNCGSFASETDAQACFDYCGSRGAGDIHRLDQGGIEGVICEEFVWVNSNTTSSSSSVFEPIAEFAGDSCTVCTENEYNCSDFSTAGLAQSCFNTCRSSGYGDIHRLDNDSDLFVCESRPRSP